ncbi:DUF2516 family protein [Nocardioides lentus]|uniref:DUF2516 family protein n=1 Tax=Nocardioides lentus TaxID=338077 RepID=A0ABN2PAL6_9ACTN
MDLNVFVVQGGIMLAVTVVLLAVKAFAFVTALTFPADAFTAADKLTKPAWLAILGIGLVFQLLGLLGGGVIGIFNLIFTVAAFVYLVDVRPALRSVTRR